MACMPRASSAAEGARPRLFLVGVVHPVEQPCPQLPAVFQAVGHGGAHLRVALRHGEDVEGGEPYLAAGLERVDDPGPELLETLQGALPGIRYLSTRTATAIKLPGYL